MIAEPLQQASPSLDVGLIDDLGVIETAGPELVDRTQDLFGIVEVPNRCAPEVPPPAPWMTEIARARSDVRATKAVARGTMYAAGHEHAPRPRDGPDASRRQFAARPADQAQFRAQANAENDGLHWSHCDRADVG